ncbi:hypothetical protein ACLMJK_001560 [Lecanora helva]
MSVQVETPQKPSRRARRPPRKSAGTPSSHMPSYHSAEPSTDSGIDKPSIQPTRILRRGVPDTDLESPPTEATLPTPNTPPHRKSKEEGPAKQKQSRNASAPDIPRNKGRTTKSQGRKQSAPIAPISDPNGVPPSAPKRESTPLSRAVGTPTKAYAGPTFHASPAASSLPLPKLFSKSVPNVDKTKSLKAMMEQDTPESSSGSEGSPCQGKKVRPISNPKPVEASPLDMLFRADREAKSRAGSNPAIASNTTFKPIRSSLSIDESEPIQARTLQSTAGSVFPLDIDGPTSQTSVHSLPHENKPRDRKESSSIQSSSPAVDQTSQEEQQRAKILALKKLLHSTPTQVSQNAGVGSRPPTSNLRNEIPIATSPENGRILVPPASPTPTQVQKPPISIARRPGSLHNGYKSPSFPIAPLEKTNQGYGTSFGSAVPNATTIENDLRRILKLDILCDNGVTGH